MPATKHIAVVVGEPAILDLVILDLKRARLIAHGFLNGSAFLRSLDAEPPLLVVLDLMLPDTSASAICRRLRSRQEFSTIPVIVLTARSGRDNKVLGLELGADDYLVKPFSPRDLTVHIKAVLRRTARRTTDPDGSETIEIGDMLRINPQKYEVMVEGKKIDVTTTEFRILQLLASRIGWVFSRERILTHLWGSNKMVLDRTIDVHIRHLREKMGTAGTMIKNMRGAGYKLEYPADSAGR